MSMENSRPREVEESGNIERTTIESSAVVVPGMERATGLGSLNDRLRQLSVSPPRQSQSMDASVWRSNTPPARPTSALVRNYSSPSLMDASPKPSPNGNVQRKMLISSNESSPASTIRQPRLTGHELTPVTKNTSLEYVDDDNDEDGYEEQDGFVVVSPDDTLHGENLTLPSAESFSAPQRRSRLSLPPLPARKVTTETLREPLELRKKFFSFNSRHQYTQTIQPDDNDDVVEQVPPGLTPYQPSRHEMGDVGALPGEELSRIFIPRSSNSSSSESSLNPIPLEERQWSIPSIRLATHLNGSNTSCTDEEDEIRPDDDASWSSRGSSLYIPEEINAQEAPVLKLGPPKPVVIVGDLQDNTASSSDTVAAVVAPKKRKGEKERRVYEWLRTVESGDDVIAEAASSKFLTGKRSFTRQQSSPPALTVDLSVERDGYFKNS